MYKNLSLLILVVIFTSCSNKNSAFEHFENLSQKSETIQFTKKKDILIDNKPKVLFWATHLNKLEKNKELEKESFLVTVYFVDKKFDDLKDSKYQLLLNDNKSLSLEKLSQDSDYKDLFIDNKWASKYLVQFNKTDDDVFKLELKLTNNTNWAQLEFEK